MKVTSNLSFLLCIGTIAMPIVQASLNGFGLKRSAASTKSSIQRQDVFDFAAQQSHRGPKSMTATALLSKHSAALKRAAKNQKTVEFDVHQPRRSLETDVDFEAATLALCEALFVDLLGPNSGCTCTDDEPSMECTDFVSSNCLFCDTLQFEDSCLFLDKEAQLAAGPGTDSFVDCLTYESGPFADKTICGIENFGDNTCAITIDGVECTSCTVITCGDEGATNFDINCSNIIAEDTWNLCTDDIPDTSLFIAVGNNDRFEDLSCNDGDLDPDLAGSAVCQTFLEFQFGVDSGCVCEFDGENFIPTCECVFRACDTIQGEEACILFAEEAPLETTPEVDSITECLTYESGPFTDKKLCVFENFADNTCAVTIDGVECNSCDLVACSDTDENYDLDCSNVIAGETWNLCFDDIPETSPFIAVGTNDRFKDLNCIDDTGGVSDGSNPGDDPEGVNLADGKSDGSITGDEGLEAGESGNPTSSPSNPGDGSPGDDGDVSGGVALSIHVLSLVGLVIVTSFW
jgi:hypothetical protein